MSSISRPLAGPMLTFDLDQEIDHARRDEAYQRSGRAGRTLAKSGRFRLVLVAIRAEKEIGTHQTGSPMTVQVVQGHLRFRAAEEDHELEQGQVLFFGPGDAHDIRAVEDSVLLLTMSAVGDDHKMDEPSEEEAPQR